MPKNKNSIERFNDVEDAKDKPLGPDFAKTSRSPGEPDEERFPDPFGDEGALLHRKQTLGPGSKRVDHGAV